MEKILEGADLNINTHLILSGGFNQPESNPTLPSASEDTSPHSWPALLPRHRRILSVNITTKAGLAEESRAMAESVLGGCKYSNASCMRNVEYYVWIVKKKVKFGLSLQNPAPITVILHVS